MTHRKTNGVAMTTPLKPPSSSPASTRQMGDETTPRSCRIQTKQDGAMLRFNSAAPAFHPRGHELQYHTPSSGSYDTTPITSWMEGESQLQRFVMTLQMNHSEDIRALAHQAQHTAHELASVKQAVGDDVRGLQDQLAALQARMAHMTELENGVVGDVGVKAEWRDKYSTEQIAAAYQTQVAFHAATATRLREERYALLAESPIENKGPESRDDSVVDASGLREGLPKGASEDEKIGSAEVEETAKPETEETRLPIDSSNCIPRGSNVADVVGDHQHSTDDGPSSIEPVHDTSSRTLITSESAPSADSPWMPLAVRQMPPIEIADPSRNTQTFTWEHIRQTLGGEQWSPGFHFISHDSILPSNSYWILDGDYEPFLPPAPGQHGAKLTAFFNASGCTDIDGFPDEHNYLRAPVFIRATGHSEYVYHGEYSQLRFSDKLDYDRLLDGSVPDKVLRYWAMQLAEQGRPAWVTDALMAHFWPQPQYLGPAPRASAGARAYSEDSNDDDHATSPSTLAALADYARLLREWKKNARLKVSLLSADTLMDCFTKADADEEPGLRLWWEYLQCVGYDQGFYEMMVSLKELGKPGLSADVATEVAPKTQRSSEVPQRNVERAEGRQAGGPNGRPVHGRGHSTPSPPIDMGGDLAMAKQLHDGFRKVPQPGRGRVGRHATSGEDTVQAKVPPHLRSGK